jgi:hypothetical protein
MHFHIHLHSEVTQAHVLLLQSYLRATDRLSRQEWRTLRVAVEYPAQSYLELQGQRYSFAQFYRHFLEATHEGR